MFGSQNSHFKMKKMILLFELQFAPSLTQLQKHNLQVLVSRPIYWGIELLFNRPEQEPQCRLKTPKPPF
jgi:hypothetical protein